MFMARWFDLEGYFGITARLVYGSVLFSGIDRLCDEESRLHFEADLRPYFRGLIQDSYTQILFFFTLMLF